MNRLLLSIILTLAPTCSGQILRPILAGTIPAAASYSGPGDVSSGAAAWWGLRAYSSATRGSAAANVCDSGDAHCVDALTDATTGALVIPSSNPNCGSSACTVKKLYDQTAGNLCGSGASCDLQQSTEANRPQLTTNCIGTTLPCLTFGSGQSLLAVGTAFTFNYPGTEWTASFVAQRSGAFTSFQATVGVNSGALLFGFANSANNAVLYANFVKTLAASDSSPHAGQALFNSASSELYIDGAASGGIDIGNVGVTTDSLCMGCGFQLFGFVTEGGWWSGDKSSSFSAMNSNQHAYWGF